MSPVIGTLCTTVIVTLCTPVTYTLCTTVIVTLCTTIIGTLCTTGMTRYRKQYCFRENSKFTETVISPLYIV
jgi:hypothetical protein